MNKKHWVAAGIVFLVNLPLILSEFTMRNWDSQAHIFHASHYLNGWFDPWEEKWYTGFWTFGYPPLVHQLIAIFSPVVGMEGAYRLVQGLFLLLLPLAVWLLSKELVSKKEAAIIALLSPGLSGMYVVLYTFGQLPSFVSFVFALLAVRFLLRYLKTGKLLELAGWFFLTGTTVAAHHHTFLFVAFLSVVAALSLCIKQWNSKLLLRTLSGVVVFGLAVSLVIAPFWWWNFTQKVDQVPIPHPTRDNIFRSDREARMFFWDMYGGMLFLLPIGVWAVIRRRELWPVGFGVVFLASLGLGGLTDFPKLVLSGLWEVLTYERFAFWAGTLSLIPVGVGISVLPKKNWVYTIVAVVLAVGVARAIEFRNKDDILPEPLQEWEEKEIVKFLDEHQAWRYVTFGLGEPQLVRLSRLTDAKTVDGFFNQVRWKWLQANSGIGTIDSAPWMFEKSYDLLFPMLQQPWEWSLRWAIVRHPWIQEHLINSGWKLLHSIGADASYQLDEPFSSLVTIWEAPKEAIPKIPKVEPGQQIGPPYYHPSSDPIKQLFRQSLPYWWGVVPLAVLMASLGITFLSLKEEKEGKRI